MVQFAKKGLHQIESRKAQLPPLRTFFTAKSLKHSGTNAAAAIWDGSLWKWT